MKTVKIKYHELRHNGVAERLQVGDQIIESPGNIPTWALNGGWVEIDDGLLIIRQANGSQIDAVRLDIDELDALKEAIELAKK